MRVYLVDGAEQRGEALDSYLIPTGSTKSADPSCEVCRYDSPEEPYDFLVEGFDDFVNFNPTIRAFLPGTPPLISSRAEVSSLAENLSGVAPVRVGFSEWEQAPVEKDRWFDIEPRLGALFVVAVCPVLFDESGHPLEKCRECGRQRIKWYRVEERIHNFSINSADWPGTDLFLLEGGDQYRGLCVTESGLEKIHEAGFHNLRLIELGIS
jgi:hypothetical protein